MTSNLRGSLLNLPEAVSNGEEREMKVWPLVLVLILAGCGPRVNREIARCEIEAVHLYPQYEAGVSSDYKYQAYVWTCMEAHGLHYIGMSPNCRGDFRSTSCYEQKF